MLYSCGQIATGWLNRPLHIHKHALPTETQIKQINIFKNSVSSENFYVILMNKRQWKKQHHCPSVWAQSFSRTSVLTDSFSSLDGCYLNQTQALLLGNKSEFWDFHFSWGTAFALKHKMQFILQCEINSNDWLGNKEVLKKNAAYPKATLQQEKNPFLIQWKHACIYKSFCCNFRYLMQIT